MPVKARIQSLAPSRRARGTPDWFGGVQVLVYPASRDPEAEAGEEGFVAHCLNPDQVATGRTPREALDALMRMLVLLQQHAEEHGLSSVGRKAPRKYWAMLRNAMPAGVVQAHRTGTRGMKTVVSRPVPSGAELLNYFAEPALR